MINNYLNRNKTYSCKQKAKKTIFLEQKLYMTECHAQKGLCLQTQGEKLSRAMESPASLLQKGGKPPGLKTAMATSEQIAKRKQ